MALDRWANEGFDRMIHAVESMPERLAVAGMAAMSSKGLRENLVLAMANGAKAYVAEMPEAVQVACIGPAALCVAMAAMDAMEKGGAGNGEADRAAAGQPGGDPPVAPS